MGDVVVNESRQGELRLRFGRLDVHPRSTPTAIVFGLSLGHPVARWCAGVAFELSAPEAVRRGVVRFRGAEFNARELRLVSQFEPSKESAMD